MQRQTTLEELILPGLYMLTILDELRATNTKSYTALKRSPQLHREHQHTTDRPRVRLQEVCMLDRIHVANV